MVISMSLTDYRRGSGEETSLVHQSSLTYLMHDFTGERKKNPIQDE